MMLATKCAPTDDDGSLFIKLCALNTYLCAEQLQLADAAGRLDMISQQLQFVALHVQQQPQPGAPDVLQLLTGLKQLHTAAAANHQQHRVRHTEIQQEISKVGASKTFAGPCVASVEPILQQHNIERQVYHGGAFIGNHVHRALKPTVVTAIAQSHIPVIGERHPQLGQEAAIIANRFKGLMTGYANCRNIFSSCNAVDDRQLNQLQANISTFMEMARKEIVARGLGNITPKLHLLEHHTVPPMRDFCVGLGLLAEQVLRAFISA